MLKFLKCLPPKYPDGHFGNIKDKVVLQIPHTCNKVILPDYFKVPILPFDVD